MQHNDIEGLGLYVHVPFCRSRCGYCTFVSSLYDAQKADDYLAALEREVAERAVRENAFNTLFIGGGTPSSLSLPQLARLFDILPPVRGEATCEINPDSASKEKLLLLRERGINRISFGVQTFSPRGLAVLQRRHSAQQAIQAVMLATSIGFPRGISVDLMHGWPGQSLPGITDDMKIAIDLDIHHLSYYSLILDADAPGHAVYAACPDEDGERGRKAWDCIEEFLSMHGFIHYETSNFSRSGFTCAHNAAIWRGGEYFGVGAGAHSHVAGRRFANCSDVEKYIQCSGNAQTREVFSERLEGREKARECAVFWLRLFAGVELAAFRRRTGYDFEELYQAELPAMLQEGVMERDATHIRVSRRHQPVLDMVLADLV